MKTFHHNYGKKLDREIPAWYHRYGIPYHVRDEKAAIEPTPHLWEALIW
jgi:hypothetical protein